MKKIYTRPEIEVTAISSTDVISLSSASGALTKDKVQSVSKEVINF
jgi:hypothetical protein